MRALFALPLLALLVGFTVTRDRVVAVEVSESDFAVVAFLTQTPDGQGPVDLLSVTYTCQAGGCSQASHSLPSGSAFVDSVVIAKPGAGQTKSGKVYWQALRSGVLSALDSASWSYTNTAVAPVIVADSVVTR